VVLVDYIFSLFPPFPVLLEELVEPLSQVFFAFAAQQLASSAPAFPFRKLAVVFFEQVEVVLEYAADRGVSARFPLLSRGAFAACESVPNLLFHYVWRVHGEYAGFRHGGAHFSAYAKPG
jgi:hypothetical protein